MAIRSIALPFVAGSALAAALAYAYARRAGAAQSRRSTSTTARNAHLGRGTSPPGLGERIHIPAQPLNSWELGSVEPVEQAGGQFTSEVNALVGLGMLSGSAGLYSKSEVPVTPVRDGDDSFEDEDEYEGEYEDEYEDERDPESIEDAALREERDSQLIEVDVEELEPHSAVGVTVQMLGSEPDDPGDGSYTQVLSADWSSSGQPAEPARRERSQASALRRGAQGMRNDSPLDVFPEDELSEVWNGFDRKRR